MAKKKAAKKAAAKQATKKAAKTSATKRAAARKKLVPRKKVAPLRPMPDLSPKANTDMGALAAPPPDQQKLAKTGQRTGKKITLGKTHAKAIQSHVSSRGRRQQAARDTRNAPRKRSV